MGEARRRTAEAKKGRRGEVCITQSSAQTYIPWSTVQGYDVGEGIAGQITEPWVVPAWGVVEEPRCRDGQCTPQRHGSLCRLHHPKLRRPALKLPPVAHTPVSVSAVGSKETYRSLHIHLLHDLWLRQHISRRLLLAQKHAQRPRDTFQTEQVISVCGDLDF